MVMTSPFFSLEHAITVARDIWFCKVNVSWRKYQDQYSKTANKELYEWRSMYEKKIGYTYFRNMHVVELNIASKEKMNLKFPYHINAPFFS
ncbi:hypothetical protein Ahy_A08g040152 [Arachis hypogaea]|uniref:Uncharacterized protein n=1 Tax=Arachis hypogaea TaxID=3818 RepID=A0A445BZ34_ARAHY|nr:hypothetical protein Ahy_A08g040152 [Arachis hypogaea]